MKTNKTQILSLLLLLSLTSCGGGGGSSLDYSVNDGTSSSLNPNDPVTFSTIKTKILNPHCLSCHADVATESGVSKWIIPGQPENSSLFTEVENGSMPKGQTPLNTQSLELIRQYIEQVASVPSTTGSSTSGSSSGGTTTPPPDTGTTTGSSTGGGTTGTINDTGISYAEVKTKVLSPYRCLNCHSVGTEAKLAKWINTSNPSQSSFYTTIKSGSMPKGGPRAGTDIQNFVLQYVNDFANR